MCIPKVKNHTRFGQEHSSAAGTLAEPAIVKLMNPMEYIGSPGTSVAPHWRIRHGTADRDASLAIPALLAAKLANSRCHVNLALP